MATDPDPAPEVKCEHVWKTIFTIAQGESVDTYSLCDHECSAVQHVYTYAPGNLRHETIHKPRTWSNGWTLGYAQGMARGMGTANVRRTSVKEFIDKCRAAGRDALGVADDPEWPVDPKSVATDPKSTICDCAYGCRCKGQ